MNNRWPLQTWTRVALKLQTILCMPVIGRVRLRLFRKMFPLEGPRFEATHWFAYKRSLLRFPTDRGQRRSRERLRICLGHVDYAACICRKANRRPSERIKNVQYRRRRWKERQIARKRERTPFGRPPSC